MPLLNHEELEQRLQALFGNALMLIPPEMHVWDAGHDAPVIVLIHGHAVPRNPGPIRTMSASVTGSSTSMSS